MKLSAQNVLKGRVKRVEHGAVTSVVTLELPGGAEIVATITRGSAERLALAEGSQAYAIVKASNVVIGVD